MYTKTMKEYGIYFEDVVVLEHGNTDPEYGDTIARLNITDEEVRNLIAQINEVNYVNN